MTPVALYNGGRPGPELAWARGLHYGDGVFRTALIWNGRVHDLPQQLAILARDAQALGLEPPSLSLLASEATALAEGTERGVLKCLLWRQGQGRGYAGSTDACDRLLLRTPAPCFPLSHWTHGVRVAPAGATLSTQPRLAGIKHLNRLEQVLASTGPRADAEEWWLCDAQGQPVCGTRSNLFMVRNGLLCTPRLRECGVHGAMRERVLACAEALGIPTKLMECNVNEWHEAEEWLMTNSLIGLWPVRAWDGVCRSAPGPLTRRLMDALAHPRLC